MVRIVSGVSPAPEFDGGAVLRGFGKGREARQREEAAQRAEMGQQIQLRRLKMSLDAEQLKHEQFLGQQAQMGHAKSVQEMAFRQRMSPTDKTAEAAMKIREGVTDPKALAELDAGIEQILTATQKQEKRGAATKEIERAVKDGVLAPPPLPGEEAKPDPNGLPSAADFMAELEAGGDPDGLVKRIGDSRMKRATAAANAEDNMAAFEQAKMRVDAAPPGRERQLARIALKEFEMSPSRMEDEGGGAKLLAAIQETLVGPLSRQDAIAESTKAWGENKPAPGLQGMSVGQRNEEMMKEPTGPVGFGLFGSEFGAGGPKVPPFTGGTHATLRGTNRKAAPEDDDLGKLLASATSDEDLASKLNSAGIPKTPENVRAIQERRRALTGR